MDELKTLKDIPQDMYGRIPASAVKSMGIRWIKELEKYDNAPDVDDLKNFPEELRPFVPELGHHDWPYADARTTINIIKHLFDITDEDLKE